VVPVYNTNFDPIGSFKCGLTAYTVSFDTGSRAGESFSGLLRSEVHCSCQLRTDDRLYLLIVHRFFG
jgi:hypothetical protein